jgi:hypothetical protein
VVAGASAAGAAGAAVAHEKTKRLVRVSAIIARLGQQNKRPTTTATATASEDGRDCYRELAQARDKKAHKYNDLAAITMLQWE